MVPPEILTNIFQRLVRTELVQISLVCRQWQLVAQPLIYYNVELVDEPETIVNRTGETVESTPVHGSNRMKMLLTSLQANPNLCEHIGTVTHRCYERPPDPFTDDDQRHLGNEELIESCIPLLRSVVERMVNVRTLYIIWGHDSIVKELLRLLLVSNVLDRLWIEAVYIGAARQILEEVASRSGSCSLRSVRLRRILTTLTGRGPFTYTGREISVTFDDVEDDGSGNNGDGGADIEMAGNGEGDDDSNEGSDAEGGISDTENDDEEEEDEDEEEEEEEEMEDDECSSSDCHGTSRAKKHSSIAPFRFIYSSSSSLINLVIDWMLPPHIRNFLPDLLNQDITFPCLKSFQVRHPYIRQPTGLKVALTHPTMVSFLLRHPNIVSFGWPAEWFCSTSNNEEWSSFLPALEKMSRNLVFFRTDVPINISGEVETVHYQEISDASKVRYASRQRAIQFIKALPFLETLKVEGSIPRDEAASIIEATKNSNIKKIVLIGISWPFELLKPIVDHGVGIAINELKFCGFGNAALLNTGDWWKSHVAENVHRLAEQTDQKFIELAQYLSQVSKLRTLTVSLNLPVLSTIAPGERIGSIPSSENLALFWGHCQSALSTEKKFLLEDISDEEMTILEKYFRPGKLAEDCLAAFYKHLSRSFEMLRVLFLMEKDDGNSGEIYDFEIYAKWVEDESSTAERTYHCMVQSFVGPRPESDPRRMQEKLDRRKYF